MLRSMNRLLPCPRCLSSAIGLQTAPGESRARAVCFTCSASGPAVGGQDTRSWDEAAVDEWNVWAAASNQT